MRSFLRSLALALAIVYAAIIAAAVGGCATTPRRELGPRAGVGLVDCRARRCPTEEQVRMAEALFARRYHNPDARDPVVIWHDADADGRFTDQWGRRVAGTFNVDWIETASWGAWVHERIHIAHMSNGFQDNHPGGLWLDPRDNDAETEMKATLRAMFGER